MYSIYHCLNKYIVVLNLPQLSLISKVEQTYYT